MDAGRFDGLAKSLARSGTRRSALRSAGGALAALGAAGSGAVEAKHRRKKKCKHTCNGTCCAKGEACVGGVCVDVQRDCPGGADSCSKSGTIGCASNLDCSCYHRVQGGTRCVQFLLPIGACDQCKTDADCVALGFPPGSSCIKDNGGSCACKKNKRGYCGEPCGFVPQAAAAATKRRARSVGLKR